jgi:hypothetical protein
MNKYLINFVGREKGAIGIGYPISVLILADTYEEALRHLYASYQDCIRIKYTVTPNKD